MRYLVAYDIKDDRRRNRLFKLLKGYGYNIQKSVFEIPIDNKILIQKLEKEIRNIIDKDEDIVYIFPFYKKPIVNEEFKEFFNREISF